MGASAPKQPSNCSINWNLKYGNHMKEKTIYALGFFDGVHLGHQALLSACRETATEYCCHPGVVTFTSHPDTLVTGNTPGLINTAADREALLGAYGMDTVVTLPFDEALRAMPWQDFFQLLLTQYGAAGFVVGEDFRFGYRGEGNARKLKDACAAAGLPCVIVPEQTVDGVRVSSTHIRSLLERGEMALALRFLGHPHIMTGTVVSGRQIGRTIGIPTANVLLPEGMIVPRLGVYACRAYVEGREYCAVTNIGCRPTVNGHQTRAESWLLDFDGDLYGRQLTLAFHTFLRPEQKFPSLEALQTEIRKNGEETRRFFEK